MPKQHIANGNPPTAVTDHLTPEHTGAARYP